MYVKRERVMSDLYEYGGVDDCGVCKAEGVPVMEYYTGGFKCFPCAGVGESENICTFCNDNAKSCRACDDSYEGE